jgi:hypothetical protein
MSELMASSLIILLVVVILEIQISMLESKVRKLTAMLKAMEGQG